MGKGLRKVLCFFGWHTYVIRWRIKGNEIRCLCFICRKSFPFDEKLLTNEGANPNSKRDEWVLGVEEKDAI